MENLKAKIINIIDKIDNEALLHLIFGFVNELSDK